MAAWLGTLLPTVHTDAARRIAKIFADKEEASDSNLLSVAPLLMPVTLRRMRLAFEVGEDSQLSRELLEVLVRLDMVAPAPPEVVREVYDLIRSRLATSDSE